MTYPPNVITFRPPMPETRLRRPRLLIRAAREGQSGWKRGRDLRRLLKCAETPPPGATLGRLRAEEAQLNAARLDGTADYDLRRHVLMMIAILAEMRAAVEPAAQTVALSAL